jgi:hypothetical protein
MNFFFRFKLVHRLGIAIGIFVLGFAVYGGWSYMTLQALKVNGPVYQQIVQDKDLIADILPPPEYIIESYLVSLQLAVAESPDEREKLIERLSALQKEYHSRHKFWESKTLNQQTADLLLRKSYTPVLQFYAIAFNELIPAVRAESREAAATAMKRMSRVYGEHRKFIDELVLLAAQNSREQEAHAAEQIRSRTLVMLSIFVCAIVTGVGVAVAIVRNIVRQLGAEPGHAADIARSIASGHLSMAIHASPRVRIVVASIEPRTWGR